MDDPEPLGWHELVRINRPEPARTGSLVMAPRAQDVHDSLFIENLVNQTVLDVDPPRVAAGKVTNHPLVAAGT